MKKINLLSEGFWDSLVTQVKRGALATASSLGSKESSGKLSALNLSTAMYDTFKNYLGATGSERSPDEVYNFLANQLGFSTQFASQQADLYDRAMHGERIDVEPEAPNNELLGRDSTEHKKVEPSTPIPDVKTTPPEPKQSTEEIEAARKEVITKFKQSTVFQQFADVYRKTGFAEEANKPDTFKFNPKADGSFVFATIQNSVTLKKILDSGRTEQEIGDALFKSGMLVSWSQFKEAVHKFGVPDPHSSDGQAELVKDSLNAGARLLGKNYLKSLNRFVLGIPEKAHPTDEFELKEAQLSEDSYEMSDKELRAFFLNTAQQALKTGEARSTARKQIRNLNQDRRDSTHKFNDDRLQREPSRYQSINQNSDTYLDDPTGTRSLTDPDLNYSPEERRVMQNLRPIDIEQLVNSRNKSVKALAQKVLKSALSDFNKAKREAPPEPKKE